MLAVVSGFTLWRGNSRSSSKLQSSKETLALSPSCLCLACRAGVYNVLAVDGLDGGHDVPEGYGDPTMALTVAASPETSNYALMKGLMAAASL